MSYRSADEKYKPHLNGYRVNVDDSIRHHRRPLYPPADKSMIWGPRELEKIKRITFRPLVMAYNEPRFVFDYHTAGGLLGHLMFAMLDKVTDTGKWLHRFSDINIVYSDGVLTYEIKDDSYPDFVCVIDATAAADNTGMMVRLNVSGNQKGKVLLACYGGASAFYSRKDYSAPEYIYDPSHSSRDIVEYDAKGFDLFRKFYPDDVCMTEKYIVPKFLADYIARIRVDSQNFSKSTIGGYNDDPFIIYNSKEASDQGTGAAVMGILCRELDDFSGFMYIRAGMGCDKGKMSADLSDAWEASIKRNMSICGRLRIKTPNQALDNAISMLAFCLEGLWGDEAVLHGALSWRFGYLGWRSWYGLVCCGWTDRIKKCIENFTDLCLVKKGEDEGALSCLYEPEPFVYYNMNEVFTDQVRQYFEYTDDTELMNKIFPVLKSILKWEEKRLKPEAEELYESCLNTWVSDCHWYIKGQCAQASAYMLNAYNLLSYIAEKTGNENQMYSDKAEKILAAIQEVLWMEDEGVFAESRDTKGRGMLHPQPELATIYHTAEFGAASDIQIDQMLNWAYNNLRQENTYNGGKLYWSANWYPNNARSYTHSTYELAYAEELNFALANYLGARKDEAYKLMLGSLCGIYSGPTPGGLPCHAGVDGRQRRNDEFADAISMFARTVYEGLFGIRPKKPDGIIRLSPQFPDDWKSAHIRSEHISYTWSNVEGKIEILWETPNDTVISLDMPIFASQITSVISDNRQTEYEARPGVSCVWLSLKTNRQRSGSIHIKYIGYDPVKQSMSIEAADSQICLQTVGNGHLRFIDPQKVLYDARVEGEILTGRIKTKKKNAMIYTAGGTNNAPRFIPNHISIARNNEKACPVWDPSYFKNIDVSKWQLISLDEIYNASSPLEVLRNIAASAIPPKLPYSQIGFEYWKIHIERYCINGPYPPVDDALRSITGKDDILKTTEGILFRVPKYKNNIGIVTLIDQDQNKTALVYPKCLSFEVDFKGSELLLLITGITYPAQSHVPNLEITMMYADNIIIKHQLINPFDIADCWGTWHGRYHDTQANGFLNIGGRFGPAGSADVSDITKPVSVDTEAHIVRIPLRNETVLKKVAFEAAANDVIFGIIGATIRK